jgi:hypothetical protein
VLQDFDGQVVVGLFVLHSSGAFDLNLAMQFFDEKLSAWDARGNKPQGTRKILLPCDLH